MKRKTKVFQVLILVLVLSTTAMKAQTNINQNPVLTTKEQSIVVISALTASGDLGNLKAALNGGLDAGLTVEETKEILVQLYAYCGFPRSLNAIGTLMSVVDGKKASGIDNKKGTPGSSKSPVTNKYEQGRKVLETLTKTPQTKPAPGFGEFAPRIDAFLKEHLFADIFESEVLNFKQRELVTISALTAMPGVTSQLQAHVKMGMNTGITESQLVEISELIGQFISISQANVLREIIAAPAIPVADKDMMVRISEIEIHPDYLTEYNNILKEEAAASVEKEPGVLAIFPMSTKAQPTQIRIVEIYADSSAYRSHLTTPHFQHYKTSTLKMVKSLKLMDMTALDPKTMSAVFKKLK